MNREPSQSCAACGEKLSRQSLACRQCGGLVHRLRLQQLSAEAAKLESHDPSTAATRWRESLQLLPAESAQYKTIVARLARLPIPPSASSAPPARAAAEPANPVRAISVTLISMIISAMVYARMIDWPFSIGLVVSILIHELGHSLACVHWGLRATPPIFIPMLGAFIGLKDRPKNVAIEAYIGIAGPIFGTVAALACLAWYWQGHSTLAWRLAEFGFFINLANLLPFRPLDGGRVVVAVLPLFSSGAYSQLPYYRIPRTTSLGIGAAYVLLAAGLIWMFLLTRQINL